MVHCFIYAPIKNGTNGELLFHDEKASGFFSEANLERFCSVLFPRFDFRELIIYRNTNVTENHVAQYYLRLAKGMLQRVSVSGTFEDLHQDEWKRMMHSHCPEVMEFGRFMMRAFAAKEENG